MAALRQLELTCEAAEAEAASFGAYATALTSQQLDAEYASLMPTGGGLEAALPHLGPGEMSQLGGDFHEHLQSYSPRSLRQG